MESTVKTSQPVTCESFNQKLRCTLEVLTPVHAGSDNAKFLQRGIDWFSEGRQVRVIDQEALYRELLLQPAYGDKTALDRYTELLSRGNMAGIEHLLDECEIDLAAIAPLSLEYGNEDPADEIRSMMRTGMGAPLLPGSGIKGALRSAIYHFLYKRLNIREYNKMTERDVLGAFDYGIMRFIMPGDVAFGQSDTEVTTLRLFNLVSAGIGWRSHYDPDLRISAETVKVGTTGAFSMSVASQWIDVIQKNASHNLHKNLKYVVQKENPVQSLFNLVNDYTHEHLRREIVFFKKYPQAQHTGHLIDRLEELQKLTIHNAGACILRTSYGSGFHAMTGDYRFEDHTETVDNPDPRNRGYSRSARGMVPARYKSRRIAEPFSEGDLMGFVKISLPPDADRIVPTKHVDYFKKQTPAATSEQAAPKPVVPIEPVEFSAIQAAKPIPVEILKLGKPFCNVRLLVKNYPHGEPLAQMSGVKGVPLKEGQVVWAFVNSPGKSGEIKFVAFHKI
ncbi:MAG: type III-A CRISPR-associated RAMP protein Csm5 [Saprospiraceae bacterium]|nr:MAG: type III-A CRISPR-associated RAMP protein Csm5 [Saprospiraceae bacterium]